MVRIHNLPLRIKPVKGFFLDICLIFIPADISLRGQGMS